jgi:multiple sugar transport system permease protein
VSGAAAAAAGSGRDTARGLLWISPWIVGFALFMALPIGISLYYSLTDYSLLERPVFVGADNYREMLGDDLLWRTVRNTAVYTLFSVSIGTVITVALAVLLSCGARGATVVRAIVFLPTVVPLVAAALGWMWLFNGEIGAINTALSGVGVDGPDWLGRPGWAMSALVIMSFWLVGGAVIICQAALQDVPDSLYEAAAIDGVGAWSRLRHVTLPLISPTILFNVVIALIWSIQVFAVPLIMTGGGPDDATNFYSMYLYRNAFVYGRMGYACAMGWLQLLVILALTATTLIAARRLVYYRGA